MINTQPIISVIIPTYKPQNYIFECLISLSKQTFDISLFEVIIVLNGIEQPYKDDISSFICQNNFTNQYILFSNEKGVSNARNLGLNVAKGNYICFVDDDDVVSDSYLSRMYEKIKDKTNTIVVSNVLCFKDINADYEKDYLSKAFSNYKSEGVFKNRSFLSSACCKIIPKSMIGDMRFNNRLSKSEDAVFMFLISKNIKSIIKTSPDSIYYRRLRQESVSRRKLSKYSVIKNSFLIITFFTKIFMKSPHKYSFRLFVSRIVATVIYS